MTCLCFRDKKNKQERVTIPIFSAFHYTQKGSDTVFHSVPCRSSSSTQLHSGYLNSWHCLFGLLPFSCCVFFIVIALTAQFKKPMRLLSSIYNPLNIKPNELDSVICSWVKHCRKPSGWIYSIQHTAIHANLRTVHYITVLECSIIPQKQQVCIRFHDILNKILLILLKKLIAL